MTIQNPIVVIKDSTGKVIELNGKPIVVVNIPSEYTRVNYIASTGTQHIDTGIIPTSDNITYEWEGRDDVASGYTSLFASEWAVDGDYSNRVFGGVIHGSKSSRPIYIGKTTGMQIGYNSNDNLFHTWSLVIKSDHTVYLVKDGTKLTTYNWTGSMNKYNTIALFCNHTTNSFSQKASVAYKYFKIKDNGKLVFWGIPIRRKSDQVLGMYDLIQNRFLTNNGTGSFVTSDNNLLFDESNSNIVERCTYTTLDNGNGVIVTANSTYGRASFVFPIVENGSQYRIDFDATAQDGYKQIYFHNAAYNSGDGWNPVYGTVGVSVGGHFTKTITSSSDVLWIGIYATANTTVGSIKLENVTVTKIG